MADRAGQQLGSYRLIRLLGSGGFAEVYLADHIYLGTQAAIKVLSAQLVSDQEREHFLTEARTIARLTHPHIVRVLDFGVEADVPYLALEYAPHGSLRQHMHRGQPQPLERLLPYIKQMAEALHHAHQQKLVHRDVKPENILLGRNNEALLSDFGLATIAKTSSQHSDQPLSGTIIYMAPEQLQGRPRPASDQYALGIITYEWLTGDWPFQGSFLEIASQHMFALPIPLREKTPVLSPAIEEVVLTALAKDPKERFATTLDFAAALEAAWKGEAWQRPASTPQMPLADVKAQPGQPSLPSDPPAQWSAPLPPLNLSTVPSPVQWNEATRPSFPPPAADTSNQPAGASSSAGWEGSTISRRAMLLTGAGALTLIGGGAALLALARRPQNGPIAQGLPTPTNTVSVPTATTDTPTPATSTPGALFTFRGQSSLIIGVGWSPDGKRIASGAGDSTIQLWDALTGNNVVEFGTEIFSMALSPDGKLVAVGDLNGAVTLWNAANGKLVRQHVGQTSQTPGASSPLVRQANPRLPKGRLSGGGVNAVCWSPDGKRVASGGPVSNVQVWDAATGRTLLTYQKHTDVVTSIAWSPDGQRIASGALNKELHVWNASTGKQLQVFNNHPDSVLSVSWSPESRSIVAATGRFVYFWDTLLGGYNTFEGHTDIVSAVAWAPNGANAASASYDRTVQVWNPTTRVVSLKYTGHIDRVFALAWSPDSKDIASGGADQTVQVWQA
ncbi:MAG TPA: serine/threonine-protein kinase [Ktedonobacterales bacterium]|jgi:serine/threonine protein kinase